MPAPPELLWYIAQEHARLELGEQLQLLLETSKAWAAIKWIEGGLLVIVRTTSSLDGVTDILMNIACICGIPIATLAH